jgi:hypothetical protein
VYVWVYSDADSVYVTSSQLATEDASECTAGSPPDPGGGTLFPDQPEP